MLENLIYDRTSSNVQTLNELKHLRYQDMTDVQKQAWIDNLKGCYRYTDLNRVEQAVAYLGNFIVDRGFNITLQPTKTWTKYDYPTQSDMKRYLANIKAIRDLNLVLKDTPLAPTNVNIDYVDANAIEKILHDVEKVLIGIVDTYTYCGEMYCGGY
jgi:hypothetical protein